MTTCTQCGGDLPADGVFCPNCGMSTAQVPAPPVRRRGVAIAVAVCVALVGVGGGAYALSHRGADTQPVSAATGATTGAGASATSTGPVMPAAPMTPAPAAASTSAAGATGSGPVMPAAPTVAARSTAAPSGEWPKAQTELQTILDRDSAAVSSRMDGRWVAKLSSKTDGVTDLRQLTAAGTHTFTWDDVLAEHLALRGNQNLRATVLLLSSSAVGDGLVFPKTGLPYLVTIADAGFSSADGVNTWCQRSFPGLAGDDLRNACMPMRMSRS